MAAVAANNQTLSESTLVGLDVKGLTTSQEKVNEVVATPVNPNGTTLPANGMGKTVSYPKSRVELVDRFLDEPRKLRVAVIGGGLSGILSGCLLPAKVPGIELVIYEKNPDFVSFV